MVSPKRALFLSWFVGIANPELDYFWSVFSPENRPVQKLIN